LEPAQAGEGLLMENDKLIETARKQYANFIDIYGEMFDDTVSDLEFLDGDQWPVDMKTERETDGRPCFVINKLPKFLDQIVGEQRQNRPQIKVKPAGGKASKDTAKVLAGLIRNIELVSDSDIAYDHAFEHMAAGGIGAWRILNQYKANDAFDQEITIKPVWNALNIAWDPDAQGYFKEDARWMMLLSKMSREAFEAAYPESTAIGFESDGKYDEAWFDKDTITVAEYFVKEKAKKTIYQVRDLANGDIDVLDAEPDEDKYMIVKEREIEVDVIKWYKITGKDILEGPADVPGEFIPLVILFGKQLNVKGKQKFRGIVRFAKDPQRLYNYSRSHGAELVELAPKSPYLMTPKMIEGHTAQWHDAHKRNYPYLLYNPDQEAAVQYPKREAPPQTSSGIQEQILLADGELNDTAAIPEAQLGEKSNEQSGKAILARQAKGQVGNYAYVDNLARAKKYTGKILLSMIPKVYDTERVERIIQEDGTEEEITINAAQAGIQDLLNDITVGRYDITVDVGPSYQTRQDEAAASMTDFATAFPAAAPVIMDLAAGAMNWPKAQMIAERLKKVVESTMPGVIEEETPPGGTGQQGASSPQGTQAGPAQQNQPGPATPEMPQASDEEMAMAAAMQENALELAEVKLAQEKAKLKEQEAKAALAELQVQNYRPPEPKSNDASAT
jgi:hypothetical protein